MRITNSTAEGQERQATVRRSYIFLLAVSVFFGLLIARLGYLQVTRGAYYEALARGNRIRLVSMSAPRGEILDRHGELLATTRPAFAASLVYMGTAYTDETLKTLEDILDLEPGRIRVLLQQQRGRWYLPIRLKTDISPEEHTRLEEHRHELPGLVIEVTPIREYPQGSLAAHVLGRVGTVNTEGQRLALLGHLDSFGDLLRSAGLEPLEYELNDITGLIGLERQYDILLRGIDGVREVEVDSRGTPTHIERENEPVPGMNLKLTVDSQLQRTLENALAANMQRIKSLRGDNYATSAAAVVLDVRTGGVLAMASLPGFDPNWSASGRLLPQYVAQLEEFNRVIQGLYIPGSTYKMMTAITALEEGAVDQSLRVGCSGAYRIGNASIGCWVGPPGHGAVNMVDAIKVSCNVYFLEMGARLRALARAADSRSGFVDLATRYAVDFGLDGPTGIDLPFERAGRSPVIGERTWYAGEDIQCAIGQSRQEYSPLQLAVYTSTIATQGIRMTPYLLQEILKGDEVIWRARPEAAAANTEVSAQTYDIVRRGMLAATDPEGTAYWSLYDIPIKVGAKTGTAQTATSPTDGLFVGFAPYDDPEIAWAIVVKHGESGSLSGAPVAREVVRAFFGLVTPPPAGGSTP